MQCVIAKTFPSSERQMISTAGQGGEKQCRSEYCHFKKAQD